MRGLTQRVIHSILLSVLVSGCIMVPTTTTSKMEVEVQVLDALTRYEITYALQAGDQLEVFVYRQPDFSRKTIVRADGFISLPLLGDVRAAGKSPNDLGKELTALFSLRLKNPEVTVMVENPPEPSVYIVGEVGGPKALPIRQAKTAAQAIAQAGVVSRGAELFSVSIVRLGKNGLLEAHTVQTEGYSQPDVYMALQNVALMPNDLIVVPESYRSQFIRGVADFNTLILPYFQFRLLQEVTD